MLQETSTTHWSLRGLGARCIDRFWFAILFSQQTTILTHLYSDWAHTLCIRNAHPEEHIRARRGQVEFSRHWQSEETNMNNQKAMALARMCSLPLSKSFVGNPDWGNQGSEGRQLLFVLCELRVRQLVARSCQLFPEISNHLLCVLMAPGSLYRTIGGQFSAFFYCEVNFSR